jgi:hypothetical protein
MVAAAGQAGNVRHARRGGGAAGRAGAPSVRVTPFGEHALGEGRRRWPARLAWSIGAVFAWSAVWGVCLGTVVVIATS